MSGKEKKPFMVEKGKFCLAERITTEEGNPALAILFVGYLHDTTSSFVGGGIMLYRDQELDKSTVVMRHRDDCPDEEM